MAMSRLSTPRILPLTIAAMMLLLAAKVATFASDAGAALGLTPAASAQADPAPAAAPAPSHPAAAVALTAASAKAGVTPTAGHDVEGKERVLLLELGKRRQALDAREHALDARNAVLEATELRLQAEIDHLAALQERISVLEKSSKQRGEGDWQGLVKVYEAMKPGDAATIFNVLDMHVLLQVLDRMKVRKAAAVLAGMQPERARLATQMLAEMRQRRDLLVPVASNN